MSELKEWSRERLSVLNGKEYLALRAQETFPLPEKLHSQLLALPKGALVEWSGAPGSGKTTALLSVLSQNPQLRAAWLEEEPEIYPAAFANHGIDLDRILFVESSLENLLWSGHAILKSGLFQILVLNLKSSLSLSEMDLRRLQLASEKSQATTVLLTETLRDFGNWAIRLQVQVSRKNEEVSLRVLKNR
ncbi:hypothetical protein K2X30_09695 [bacterium]|nr:hypothetical protein [bacterium]